MTSDHGSIRVQNDVMVSADRTASSGVRYKYGRNINTNPKNALVIRDPKEYQASRVWTTTNICNSKK